MKLAQEQIQQVNQRLIDFGFTFIDIRIEVLDHILCLIEEKENIDFQQAVDLVFEEQKEHLKEQKRMTFVRIVSSKLGIKDVFVNPMFLIFWMTFFVLYSLLPFSSKEILIEETLVLPMSIPIFAFIIYGIYFLKSKNKSLQAIRVLFTISTILMCYLYFGIPLVKKLNNEWSVVLISGASAVSLMMYYLFFYYKNKNEKKFKSLLNS
ncbi:MAG TPA: hypothetical protein VLY87_05555 [Flavobacterium sp.]|nr:hypothetical protein [Flavobacterium sp.]